MKLAKDWGDYKAGKVLAVLKPGENPRSGAVDPLKAETLKQLGYFEGEKPKRKTKARRKK